MSAILPFNPCLSPKGKTYVYGKGQGNLKNFQKLLSQLDIFITVKTYLSRSFSFAATSFPFLNITDNIIHTKDTKVPVNRCGI
jgi:hypothetical protein